MKSWNLKSFSPLFWPSLIYLALSCPFINLPGIEYDEVIFGSAALGVNGDFVTFRWSAGGHLIPLMLMPYIGAIKAYIYKPIFMLVEPSALTIRLPVIIIGLVALALTYLLVRNLFERRVAFVVALLLATDPAYVFHLRTDRGPVALMLLFKVGSLYFLSRFAQTKRSGYLAAGALFLGLGLYDKANFLWYLFALPLAAFLIWPRECRSLLTRQNALTALKFFILGSWPFWLYNIAKKGATFNGQLQPTGGVAHVIRSKTQLLIDTMNGNAAYRVLNNGDSIGSFVEWRGAFLNGNSFATKLLHVIDFRGTLMPFVLLASIVFLVLVLRGKQPAGKRAVIFLGLLSILILFQILLTPRATGSHHMMMLYPFPEIIVAYAVSILLAPTFNVIGNSRALRIVAGVATFGLLTILIVSNLVVDAKYHKSFVASGGKGVWSDAIYELTDYASRTSGQKLVLMDWGFENQLQLLSRGAINSEEFFWALLDAGREDQLVDMLYQKVRQESGDVFVFHAPGCTQFSEPRRVFDRMLEKYGRTAETVKVFNQRDGEPVYILQRVR